MFWLLLLIVFCIGLTLFLYPKRRIKQASPDHSYIIFKDYSSDHIRPVAPYEGKAVKVDKERSIVKQEAETENNSQTQEEPLCPILNFED